MMQPSTDQSVRISIITGSIIVKFVTVLKTQFDFFTGSRSKQVVLGF